MIEKSTYCFVKFLPLLVANATGLRVEDHQLLHLPLSKDRFTSLCERWRGERSGAPTNRLQDLDAVFRATRQVVERLEVRRRQGFLCGRWLRRLPELDRTHIQTIHCSGGLKFGAGHDMHRLGHGHTCASCVVTRPLVVAVLVGHRIRY